MSKKDRQNQHLQQLPQTIPGKIQQVEQLNLQQPLTPQLMNEPEKAPDTSGDPSSMGREARIQHLEGEAHRLSQLAATMKTDLEIIAKAARHGAPPEGFEPKTAEGKEALDQVVQLGSIAKEQRARADDEYTRAERAMMERARSETDVAAIIEERDQMRVRISTLEAAAASPAMPATGWASATARQLVEAVPPHERLLLLGDLLAQLLPHTGEQGQNETASDVLKRALSERRQMTDLAAEVERIHADLEARLMAQSKQMAKVQSAMVARRAPDATVGVLLEDFVKIMGPAADAMGHDRKHLQTAGLPILLALVKEWQGLRAFFSEAPFTAVAVREDGHKGPVSERYSLLVFSWDGKAVQTQVVEGTRPWGDISPYLEQTMRKHLIPGAYR